MGDFILGYQTIKPITRDIIKTIFFCLVDHPNIRHVSPFNDLIYPGKTLFLLQKGGVKIYLSTK
jgi:hypothetical protein